jgi:hypothetical protein
MASARVRFVERVIGGSGYRVSLGSADRRTPTAIRVVSVRGAYARRSAPKWVELALANASSRRSFALVMILRCHKFESRRNEDRPSFK